MLIPDRLEVELFGAPARLPIGPALLLSVMIVAAISVHWKNGVFATANGIEVPLLYAAGAVALAFTGFGPFSLDARGTLGLDREVPGSAGELGAATRGRGGPRK